MTKNIQLFKEKLLTNISVDFNAFDQILIRYSAFVRQWRRKWQYKETANPVLTDFRKPTVELGGK
jgi:hypothetical protein